LWQPVLLFFLPFHSVAAGKEDGGRLTVGGAAGGC
jgi:hypothetical protein